MIDSHHHLWAYNTTEFGWITKDMEVIRRSFMASDLSDLLEGTGVTGTVAVQARTCLEENTFLLEQARESQLIQGIVGWVDLSADDVAGQLDRYCADTLFKGIREITQGASDDQFFDHPRFNEGVKELAQRGLTYDVLIFQDQLDAAICFIDRHPDQSFVLDHGGKPEIRREMFPDAWEKGIREMAKRDHLVCKLSGLATEVRDASWDDDLMCRYIDVLLESFGPTRLMFGSDWPVCLLASEYRRWQAIVQRQIAQLSSAEQDAILSQTARHFYSL